MVRLHTLYPLGLAAANVAVGWLLYLVFDFSPGAVLALVGVVVLLAVVWETFQTATVRASTRPQRTSRPADEQPPPDHAR